MPKPSLDQVLGHKIGRGAYTEAMAQPFRHGRRSANLRLRHHFLGPAPSGGAAPAPQAPRGIALTWANAKSAV